MPIRYADYTHRRPLAPGTDHRPLTIPMELAEVHAFLAVVTQGSFTRAAASLGLSQPAISRRVELLERELGAPLFDRLAGSAGIRLTPAGEAFLPHARALLSTVKEGVAAVQSLESPAAGAVTFALVGALATPDVVARLQSFRAAAPAVRLTLRTGPTEEVAALVRSGDAHLGLLRALAPLGRDRPDLESVPTGHETPTVICAPGHPLLTATAALDPEALAGHTWVTLDPTVLRRLLARAGLRDPDLIAIDSREAQVRLVNAGFGIGLVPHHAVARDIESGTLRTLPVPDLSSPLETHLVWRRGYLPAPARLLRDTLTRP